MDTNKRVIFHSIQKFIQATLCNDNCLHESIEIGFTANQSEVPDKEFTDY